MLNLGRSQLGCVGVGPGARPLGHDAVFEFELCVDLGTCGTSACFEEALFEVFAKVRVQDRIDGRVDVTEAAHQQEEDDVEPGAACAEGGVDNRYLGDPVGQPTKDVHGYDREDQLGYFPVGASFSA